MLRIQQKTTKTQACAGENPGPPTQQQNRNVKPKAEQAVTNESSRMAAVKSFSSDNVVLADALLASEPTIIQPFTVKLDLQGDTRRLKLTTKTIFEVLQSVKRCFGLKPRQFSMSYHDDEGDMVAVYLDQELQEAFEVAKKQGKVLKLFVTAAESSSSMTSSSSSRDKSLSSTGHSRTTASLARSLYASDWVSTSGSSGGSGDPFAQRRGQRKQWREKRADANSTGKWHPQPASRAGQSDSHSRERLRLERERPAADEENAAEVAPVRSSAMLEALAEAAAERFAEGGHAKGAYVPPPEQLQLVEKQQQFVTHSANKEPSANPVHKEDKAVVTFSDTSASGSGGGASKSKGRVVVVRPPPWTGAWASRTFKAKFMKDLNLPDRSQVKPSQTLIKTWQLSNSGTMPWPRGTGVKLFRSCTRTADPKPEMEPCEIVDPDSRFPVQAATPGQTVDVSVILTTPPSAGRCRAFFRLVTDENQFFGPRMWLDIDVVNPPPPTSDEPAKPVPDAELECDDVDEETGRDLCEEFELLRNVTGEDAVHEDEIYANTCSNPGSKAGSERSSDSQVREGDSSESNSD
eukprot:gb/GEZN01003593.1/.p1 GENE.gb/GEZN01003593.1/~~gb/GEZN01003593.1/.p1  ORF type:complete len:577 (-),score=83.15 gb/GEZN01003593.1/:368-2098(-)